MAAAEIVFLVELYEIGQENISCNNRMKVEYARGETQANRRKSHFCIEKSLLAKAVASVGLDGGSQKEGLVLRLQFWSRDKSNTHNLLIVNQFKTFICEAHDFFIAFKYLHRADIIDFF